MQKSSSYWCVSYSSYKYTIPSKITSFDPLYETRADQWPVYISSPQWQEVLTSWIWIGIRVEYGLTESEGALRNREVNFVPNE